MAELRVAAQDRSGRSSSLFWRRGWHERFAFSLAALPLPELNRAQNRNRTRQKSKRPPVGAFRFYGGEGGMDSNRLRAILTPCGAHFVRPRRCRVLLNRAQTLNRTRPKSKKPPEGGFSLLWRRGWDLNPRRATNPCWFSRPVHSTTLPPLRGPVERPRIVLADPPGFKRLPVGALK